jgi:ferrochelatase
MADRVRDALSSIDPEQRPATPLIFTAHSIPLSMAASCRYEAQLKEASALVARALGHTNWTLAYQSRSGPPTQPWLEPDVGDVLREAHQARSVRNAALAPIGFISDHMEVKYDLDVEIRRLCEEMGIRLIRAATAGTHPRFIAMIRELIEERTVAAYERPVTGVMAPEPDVCPADCCPSGRR